MFGLLSYKNIDNPLQIKIFVSKKTLKRIIMIVINLLRKTSKTEKVEWKKFHGMW